MTRTVLKNALLYLTPWEAAVTEATVSDTLVQGTI